MIILSTILLIALNGIISSMINLRFGRNWAMAYSVFTAAGITFMIVSAAKNYVAGAGL